MIVGHGLIATAFHRFFSDDENICIFASGVSNSKCFKDESFRRERDLLVEHILRCDKDCLFVYFGTCSLYDPDLRGSPYVKHKVEMEAIVKSHPKYIIFRLPQVVGQSNNPDTLTNYIYKKILLDETFDLLSHAMRNIIDVDDVALIANQIVKDINCINKTINIANPTSISVVDVVSIFEDILQRKARFVLRKKGSSYQINTNYIQPVINFLDLNFDGDYVKSVLNKYYLIR